MPELVFNPTEKQALAYDYLIDDKTTEIGFGGGAGGGKSLLGCFWILSQCLAYPGVRYAIGRKELKRLRITTLMTFFEVIKMLGLPKEMINLNNQLSIIHFPKNGSQIILLDMGHMPSDPLYTRFGSLELTGVFIDESNECQAQAIEIIKTRLGRCKNQEYNIKPKLLETFNPSKDHVYFRYYKPFRDKQMPEFKVFIPALARDNPHLNPEYIKQLQNADKVTRERLLNGNFEYDDDPTRLFEFDAIQDMFTKEPDDSEDMFMSVDVARFGVDLTVVYLWKGFTVMKVWYIGKNTTTELSEFIKKKATIHGVRRSNIVIDEDGIGGACVDQLSGVKGFIANSRPIPEGSKQEIPNFANLKTQIFYKCAKAVNAGEVSIYPDFPLDAKEKLIEDLEQVKRGNPDKDEKIRLVSKDEIKEVLGRSPDFGDGFAMRWYFTVKPVIILSSMNVSRYT